ncbi:hypothetical protein OIU74_001709 [Salix koriyanagi]|uniref:Uncharacterized protein n=1 Tax=Salix koriyanagi TaxID=2511006 RepID=A0A9Q0X3F9_9ROSI|nr:hypothetical protein OIU74_001709 [Salix koriyanagi]
MWFLHRGTLALLSKLASAGGFASRTTGSSKLHALATLLLSTIPNLPGSSFTALLVSTSNIQSPNSLYSEETPSTFLAKVPYIILALVISQLLSIGPPCPV